MQGEVGFVFEADDASNLTQGFCFDGGDRSPSVPGFQIPVDFFLKPAKKRKAIEQEARVQDELPMPVDANLSDVKCSMKALVQTGRSGKAKGLLVRIEHAMKFVAPSKNERKVLEIRSRPVKFLSPGDKVALLGCGTGCGNRRVVAILEFQKCFMIPIEQFAAYAHLHQVSPKQLDDLRKLWSNQDTCYAWEFSVYEHYTREFVVAPTPGEMWVHFDVEMIRLAQD